MCCLCLGILTTRYTVERAKEKLKAMLPIGVRRSARRAAKKSTSARSIPDDDGEFGKEGAEG